MKKILSIFLLFFISHQSLNSMMDEDGEYFPVSSGVSRKVEQESLVKEIAELRLQKAQLEQQIENKKKELSHYETEIKALAAIRRIRKNYQEDEAATLLAKAFIRLHLTEKKEQ